VKLDGTSILNFGSLSILSFHATKVFTTFEGGAIISHDPAMKKRIDNLKNFGFAGETTIVAPGINAKMNEFQAALGVLQLKYVHEAIEKRRIATNRYRHLLTNISGVSFLNDFKNVEHCYSYFPILINSGICGKTRDEVYGRLKEFNIYSRRYFYPLISNIPTYRGLETANPENLPIANSVANQVLCLPLYSEIGEKVDYVVEKLVDILEK